MALTPFTLPPGVVRGATARTTPQRFFDSNLCRWREGVLEPIGGWVKKFDTQFEGVPRTVYGWASSNDGKSIAVGTDSKLYAVLGDEVTDITPPDYVAAELDLNEGGFGMGMFGDEDFGTPRSMGDDLDYLHGTYISADNFGTWLVCMSSADGRVLLYDPAAAPEKIAKEIDVGTDANGNPNPPVPRGCQALLVSPERFLIVIGADGFRRRVAWASRETVDDWSYSDITTTAGYFDLDTASYLMTARSVREGTLIWSETDVFLMTYVGQPAIHGFKKLLENSSLMNPYTVAAANGQAFWMSRTGFQWYANGYIQDLPCDLQDFVFNDMDPFWTRIHAHAIVSNVFPEIYFFYPPAVVDQADLDDPNYVPNECTKYIVYNYVEKWWAPGRMKRSAGIPSLIGHDPVWASPDGYLYRHEIGSVFSSEGASAPYAETGAVPLGGGNIGTIRQIIPDQASDFDGTEWMFYGHKTPEGVETAYGPFVARPDGYLDVRLTERDARLRITQTKDAAWSMGQPLIDVVPRGRR